MFLLQCMQKLHHIDSEYKLYFAGAFQDAALEQYILHMTKRLGLGKPEALHKRGDLIRTEKPHKIVF